MPTDQGIEAALTANAVKTALRAHAQYHRQAERLLKQVNLTLWTGSAGDQFASLFCGLIETATGRVHCAIGRRPCGRCCVAADGWQSLSRSPPPLGESPETDFRAVRLRTAAGRGAGDLHRRLPRRGRRPGAARWARPALAELIDGPSSALPAERLGRRGPRTPAKPHAAVATADDRTILVVKRHDGLTAGNVSGTLKS